MLADRQNREYALAGNGHGTVPCPDLLGNLGLDTKLTIPQSPMMGANVAYRVESQKPGAKHRVVNAKQHGHLFANVLMDSAKKRQDAAEQYREALQLQPGNKEAKEKLQKLEKGG